MGFRVEGLGSRVEGVGLGEFRFEIGGGRVRSHLPGVSSFGFGGFRFWGLGFRVYGFRIEDSGFKVYGLGVGGGRGP